LRRFFVVGDLGPAPFFYSTSIVAAVSFAASVLPAWSAGAISDGGDPERHGIDVALTHVDGSARSAEDCCAAGDFDQRVRGIDSASRVVSGSDTDFVGDPQGTGWRAIHHAAGSGRAAGTRNPPEAAETLSASADARAERLRDV